MEIKLQKRFRKLVLPAASVLAILIAAGVVLFVSSNSAPTTAVLVANKDLAEGAVLKTIDFQVQNVSINLKPSPYLAKFQSNMVLLHSIGKGEFISKLALGRSDQSRIPFRINGLRPISKAITVGDHVDVWATEISHSTVANSSQPVAFDAIVTLIEESTSMAQESTNIELRIREDYLETLLNATDSNFQLSIILHETLADIE